MSDKSKCHLCERELEPQQAILGLPLPQSDTSPSKLGVLPVRLCERCYQLQVRVDTAPDWLLAEIVGWRRALRITDLLAGQQIIEHQRLVDPNAPKE